MSSLLCAPPLSADSSTADEHYSKGLKLYLSGQYDDAAAELKQALAKDADHAQAQQLLQLLGEMRKGQGSSAGVVAQLTSALQTQEQETHRLKSILSSAEQRIAELAQAREALQGELAARHKERDALQEEVAGLTKRLEARDEQIKQRDDAYATLNQQHVRLQAEHEELERQLASLQQTHREEVADLQRQLTQAQQDRTQLSSRLATLEQDNNQLKGVAQEVRRLKEVLAKTERQLTQANAERDSLKTSTADARRGLEEAQQKRQALQQELKELGQAKQQLAERLEGAQQQHAKSEEQIGATSAKLKANEQRFDALQQETQSVLLRARDTEQQLTAELTQARQAVAELAAATSEIDRLTEALTAERQAYAALQQELQAAIQAKADVDATLEVAQRKQGELQQQLAARDEHAQELQVQLAASKQQASETIAEFGTNLNRLMETKDSLEAQLKERDAALADARARLQQVEGMQQTTGLRADQLEQDLGRKQRELDTTVKTLASANAEQTSLQQQLKVAKQSQAALAGELERLQANTAGYEQLKTMLLEKESQTRQLQGQVERLTRETGDVKATLTQVQADFHGNQQQVLGERQGHKWRLEQLQRELDNERLAASDLKDQLEAERTGKHQLVAQLAEQESRLKQAESVIRLLQGHGFDPAEAALPDLAQPLIPDPPAATPSGLQSEGGQEASGPGGTTVKVYQVNDELGFVVLSIKDVEWAQKGVTCLLAAQNQEPVATVELTELDSEGFAVAQITRRMEPMKPLQKGDLLLIRPLLRPAPE